MAAHCASHTDLKRAHHRAVSARSPSRMMAPPNMNTGWQVVGYASEARFIQDKAIGYTMNAPDMMSYALRRDDPGMHAKNHRMPTHSTLPRSEKQANPL